MPDYETASVQRGDVRDIVLATGEIRDAVEMAVPVTATARVSAIHVRLGQRVRKGDVLATLKPDEVTDDREDAVAAAEQARIARQVAANRFAKASASYAGVRQLYDRGFVAKARLAAEEADMELERLQLRAEDRKLASGMERAARVGNRFEERDRLRSPCDCRVEDVNIVLGQLVSPTVTDAFYLSGGGDMLTIRAKVPEQDLGRVQAAGTVRFGVETLPDQAFPANIDYISNHAVKEGRFTYYTVFLNFTRQDPAIRPGMTANVEFVNADSRNVLVVPTKALYFLPEKYIPLMPPFVADIYNKARTEEDRRLALAMATGAEFGMLFRQGKRKIFVLENGKPVRRLIRVGAETTDAVEAASGLNVGDVVVLAAKPSRP